MAVFTGEVLKITPTGETEVVLLEITSDDGIISDSDPNQQWVVDGISLGATGPAIEITRMTFEAFSLVSRVTTTAYGFSDGTNSYYLISAGYDPNDIQEVTALEPPVPLGGGVLGMSGYGLKNVAALVYNGDAYRREVDTLGNEVSTEITHFWVADDDPTIEFAAETGLHPVSRGSGFSFPIDLTVSDLGAGDTTMVLTDVEVTTATGVATFFALRSEIDFGSGTNTFYLPITGTFDVSTITGYVTETVLPTNVEGQDWSLYSLLTTPRVTEGGAGNEGFNVHWNDDSVIGNEGNDTMLGDHGADTLEGGAGDDMAFGGIGADVLDGGLDNDHLSGGPDNDSLLGDRGVDTLLGGIGDDTLDGGKNADLVQGGDGNDLLLGGQGEDSIKGNMGDDTIDGGEHDDLLFGDLGKDGVSGGDGDDELYGGFGRDTLDGGFGHDTLNGQSGHDEMFGDEGNDLIEGEEGRDTADGGAGDDTIYGGTEDDSLSGGIGLDSLFGDEGLDTLFGGDDADTLDGGLDADSLMGEAGEDMLKGGKGADTLDGGTEADEINGGNGADNLIGGAGADSLYGNKGDDTLEAGKDNDLLEGQTGFDSLSGGKGDDTLDGGQDDDTLDGGLNSDVLTGGAGADVFVFAADGATDTITDFEDGVDLIDLDVGFAALVFTDIVPGEVHITHSGETLIVLDGTGQLTSADFDAGDFI